MIGLFERTFKWCLNLWLWEINFFPGIEGNRRIYFWRKRVVVSQLEVLSAFFCFLGLLSIPTSDNYLRYTNERHFEGFRGDWTEKYIIFIRVHTGTVFDDRRFKRPTPDARLALPQVAVKGVVLQECYMRCSTVSDRHYIFTGGHRWPAAILQERADSNITLFQKTYNK